MKEIYDMIQRNKNSFYLNMFMERAKKRNTHHAYLNHNLGQMAPFSYTKFKIPSTGEISDLTPLTSSLKIKKPDFKGTTKSTSSGDLMTMTSPQTPVKGKTSTIKELRKHLKFIQKNKVKRKRKIRSLISERNDREYYLSLNTNQFKSKISNLRKMDKGLHFEFLNYYKSRYQT